MTVFEENVSVSGSTFRQRDGIDNKWKAEIQALRGFDTEENDANLDKATVSDNC